MADPRVKQMKIKTGVVKRYTKEKGYYEKELLKEEERLETKRSNGADEYELRKQNEVIQESKQMIPDTKNRLSKAKDELQTMLDNEKDLAEVEEYKEATQVIEEAIKALEA